MHDQLRAALGGAVAGAVATVPMSVVMLAAERVGLMGAQPPALIAEEGLERAGVRPSAPATAATATVLHFAFGAGAGALFGLGHGRGASSGPPFARGIGYGLLVYAASYAGWVPAVGIMPAPTQDRPGRQPAMIAAHVVFGAALAVLVGALVPRPRR